jgi:hypothetical protein
VPLAVDILSAWDARRLQTRALHPRGAPALVLRWQETPPPDEPAVPAPVADALTRCLAAAGRLAFRTGMAPRGPLGRLLAGLPRARVALQADPRAALALFDFDWPQQGQAVLVIPAGADEAAALEALATRRDWSAAPLPAGTLALLAPIVDGDGAILAAASPALLAGFEACLRGVLGGVGHAAAWG